MLKLHLTEVEMKIIVKALRHSLTKVRNSEAKSYRSMLSMGFDPEIFDPEIKIFSVADGRCFEQVLDKITKVTERNKQQKNKL